MSFGPVFPSSASAERAVPKQCVAVHQSDIFFKGCVKARIEKHTLTAITV